MVSAPTYKNRRCITAAPVTHIVNTMKKKSLHTYIYMEESVNGVRVSREDIQEAETLEMDMKTMMRLIDLIFLCRDDSKDIPS